MAPRRSRTEKSDKAEAVASSDLADAPSPMDRFKSVARRVVRVSREEYAEAERQYRETRDAKT
jgi:hypothetical protein